MSIIRYVKNISDGDLLLRDPKAEDGHGIAITIPMGEKVDLEAHGFLPAAIEKSKFLKNALRLNWLEVLTEAEFNAIEEAVVANVVSGEANSNLYDEKLAKIYEEEAKEDLRTLNTGNISEKRKRK